LDDKDLPLLLCKEPKVPVKDHPGFVLSK
jgi:hypothetical protein